MKRGLSVLRSGLSSSKSMYGGRPLHCRTALPDRPAEPSPPPPEPPELFAAADEDQAASDAAAHMTEVAAGTWNALLLVPGQDYGLAILGGEGAEELLEGVVARLEEWR